MEEAGLGIRENRGGVRIWKKARDGDQMMFGKREQRCHAEEKGLR